MKKFPKTVPDFPLTKLQRKLLRMARQLLKDEDENYICYALEEAVLINEEITEKRKKAEKASDKLTSHIMKALQHHSYLGAWQESKGIKRDLKQQRKDRIKWINYLLKLNPS